MKDLISSILNIFRWIGKFITGIRIFTLNIAFLALLVFLFVSLTSSTTEKEVKISESGALVLSLSGDIVEEKQVSDPIATLINEKIGFDTIPSETLFQDILDVIAAAANDDRVTCILLDLGELGSVGLNQLQTIGDALNAFKASGKKVIAAEDFYQQKAYYLASFADEIYLNPMGGVDLHGLGTFRLFFKDAIDNLKINYNIFRVGTFKSALEPVMRNSMSTEARSQNMTWLTALWNTITTDIIRERNLSQDSIQKYTENIASELATAGGDSARLALESGLVDGLKTREELRLFLTTLSGKNEKGDFRHIPFNNYLATVSRSYTDAPDAAGTIGIIIAEGAILSGKQPVGMIGGDTMIELLRQARENSRIKGLVIRIVSGGGSVFASELIRQEILEYKKTGKPLVISMGAMAASGGYWIAADADEIWASPVTLTGSIGIFAAIPTFENSLSDLGIYSDGVGTTSLAAALDITRPLSPLLKEAIEINLRHGYETFLNIVSKGRTIAPETIHTIAEGRVFDGQKAVKLGLVDNLGTLDNAIDSAAGLAGLEEYTASYIHRPLSVKEEFFQIFSGSFTRSLAAMIPPVILAAFNDLIDPVSEIMLLNDPKGLYAHCLIHDLSL
ncbi:signal peptide peptidase A [Desulfocapsa sulfexigens DSM 10523]|uniref:Signal peptide peptidase A n=1 Tax=Desulfocapsa sulfexigens (strain DSM 10523 / SB164P1) TaxID=1167006 RepID=M1P5X9_DESSD|nr:signal peptide peptidase SppA [Desulfocapsa sulfexigens]AGF78878.1 signal peptide peptidase A [Desulfocapsa sulfexigens DSM 10523]